MKYKIIVLSDTGITKHDSDSRNISAAIALYGTFSENETITIFRGNKAFRRAVCINRKYTVFPYKTGRIEKHAEITVNNRVIAISVFVSGSGFETMVFYTDTGKIIDNSFSFSLCDALDRFNRYFDNYKRAGSVTYID